MKNINKTIHILLFFCIASFVRAQTAEEIFLQNRVSNFIRQTQVLPQEKIFIHTDKSYYMNGEQIYFRAHLVDAMYHLPVSGSRYIYVELINPMKEVVERLRVRADSTGAYYGQFDLPEDLAEGGYKLRSYTQFMRNIDDEYFFSGDVFIADPNSRNLQISADFYKDKSRVLMTISLKDLKEDTIELPEKIQITTPSGSTYSVSKRDDAYRINLSQSDLDSQRVVCVECSYRGYDYRKFVHVLSDESFHVSFFPEGGQLLNNVNSRVAFKSVGIDGAAEPVSVELFDNSGNQVAVFQSDEAGMGLFNFFPVASEKYYAICKNNNEDSIKVEMPQASIKGAALLINPVRDNLYVSVNRTDNLLTEQFYLLAHTRGQIWYADVWSDADAHLVFEQTELPAGVTHFILLNSSLKPISERLVFVKNPVAIADVDVVQNKLNYSPRERVVTNLTITDNLTPVAGNLSVSVTDDNEVLIDTTTNILTHFLLTSDLRGKIFNPSSYFDASDRESQQKLDMLMLTQGWRRYDIRQVFDGIIAEPVYSLEKSMKVAGKVQGGLFLDPVERAQVSVFSNNKEFVEITETNKAGEFHFDNFELPERSQVMVQAISKKGSDRMVLSVEQETFPEVKKISYSESFVDEKLLFNYLQKEELKEINEKGMRVKDLDEIVVTAKKIEETRSAYTAFADHSMTADEIGKVGGLTIKRLLDRFGSVDVSADGNVSIRGKSPVLLLVNDIETDLDFLDDIDPYDVLRIDILQSTLAFGTKSANGVVSISTKSLQGISDRKRFNIHNLYLTGYHQPVEFYSPIYDDRNQNDETPDLRTTIYWNPNVTINEDGKGSFSFYTADQISNYTLLIQGVTDTGKIMFYKGKIANK